jgi:hypothetical protein
MKAASRNYVNRVLWQKGHQLMLAVYYLTRAFPRLGTIILPP